jgi:DNA-binding CsgD family transcriptional regulator
MDREKQHDRTVAMLYEAAMEPARWRNALSALREMLDAVGAGLLVWNERENVAQFVEVAGIFSESTKKLYAAYFGAIDPRRELLQRTPVGLMINSDAYFDDDFVKHSEFYNDFLIPQGARHTTFGKLLRTSAVSTQIAFERNAAQGPMEPGAFRQLAALSPHLRNAARLHNLLPRGTQHPSIGSLVLEHLSDGVVIADARGRIIWMNRPAGETLASEDGLRIDNGALTAARIAENAELQKLLKDAIRMAAGRGGPGGSALRVTRASADRTYTLVIAPLSPEASLAAEPSEPMALVIIRDADRHAEQVASHFGEAFGLSQAERRLAAALAGGLTMQETEIKLDRRISTLRTQLRSVLAKTGARGQTDLLRMMLAFPTVGSKRAPPGG